MKIVAAMLFVMGVFLALVAPHFWRDFISGAGVQVPQFIWSKSPPRTIYFSATTFLRVIGIFLAALSILCFILFRGADGK